MGIDFRKGERWLLDGAPIVFDQALTSDFLLFLHEESLKPVQVEDDDGCRTPDMPWVIEAYAAGRLVRRRHPGAYVARRLETEREYDPETIRRLDPRARLRLLVLRELDCRGLHNGSENTIGVAVARIWREGRLAEEFGAPPSPRTVIRWMGRGVPGDRKLRDVMSLTGRVPRSKRLAPEAQALIDRWVQRYWRDPSKTMVTAYAQCAVRVMRLSRWRELAGREPVRTPSFETFRRQIQKTRTLENSMLKSGKKKGRSQMKAIAGSMTARRSLQLGCMDHTRLDAVAVLDGDWMLPIGSPWLTLLIDVRSRCVVGFVLSFEPPSIYSVMECLRRAGTPKVRFKEETGPARNLVEVFGRFDEIVVDNGKEFAGLSFEDALSDIGTTLRLAPVATPEHKAIVERFFRTLNQLLIHQLPGARLPIHTLRELGYDPAARAVLTVEQIEDLIWDAIRLYHLERHSTLGAAPAAVWQKDAQRYGIPVHSDLRQLDKMLGAVAEGRRLSRSGIEIHGLQYRCAATVQKLLNDLVGSAPVRGQRRSGSMTCKVKVKYNPANIAEVHVWHHLERRYYTLPCCDPEYAQGMSLWHHNKLKEWARAADLAFTTQQDRLQARAKLAAKVDRLFPDITLRRRSAVARIKKAPVQTSMEGVVEMRFATSRHDGLAPVIDQICLASSRTDAGLASSRPAPRKKAKSSTRRRQPTATKAMPVTLEEFGPGATGLDWKGFE
ncbi:Mu transposase C-terminal domain-containing protein [Brevundimonas sp. SL130]|uniref:Mu transposase C-terminal domain-containing protein n=1 Tax=Brevundimonas sp. SL130 TaxID=2995143 RepID=UPI00226CEAFD|nr:Mu transposase C-terminal domain-containing protein [Brevundimonas sp. SL130]WAC59788.1 Mu transposase C-terminal domain-containing protein [Brevundimonas sp. SL130]